jgi:regulator of sigma E protease
MSIFIFIIILLVLVLVHEFGHFFSAKCFGIRVDEFGFGFPPKLLGVKRGETEYTLNLLPLGGFVKIYGEDPDEENTHGPDAGRSFVNKPPWQQAIVLVAGVFANFLLAWFLFSFGFMTGLPTSVGSEPAGTALTDVNLVVISVLPGSPAEISGLKSGDKIISIETSALGRSAAESISHPTPDTLKSFVVSHGSRELQINYLRGNTQEISSAKMTPTAGSDNGEPLIGISMDEIGIAKLPLLGALTEGLKLNWYMVKGTASGLYGLISQGLRGKGSLNGVTGPVGLVGVAGDAYRFGFVYLLSFAALISINLAVINLLPFPALDGGRLFFLLIEKIKGSRINPKISNTANMIGFGALMLLMLIITYHDVVKLF